MSEYALAAIVQKFGAAPIVEQLPLPQLEPGAMLVRVEAATLCGTDVHFWRGGLSPDRLPYIPGHETVGTVERLAGPITDVTGRPISAGDRITWSYPFCGACFYCTVARQPTLCARALRWGRERSDRPPFLLGGCATHHYVPPGSGIISVPPGLPAAAAASSACALRTVMHAFEKLGPQPYSGQSVLVQGAGPVGLYAVKVAVERGFGQVAVIGAPAERVALAAQLGAAATVDLQTSDPAERRAWALELTRRRGFDVVLQCASLSAVPEGLSLVRSGGSFISVGVGGSTELTIPSEALSRMITVSSISAAEARHYYQAVQFLTEHADACAPILSSHYDLNSVAAAFEAMSTLREIKPVVIPSNERENR